MAAADSSKTISLHYHMYSGCRFNYDGCDLKSIPLSGTVGYLISLKRRILHICQISPKSCDKQSTTAGPSQAPPSE